MKSFVRVSAVLLIGLALVFGVFSPAMAQSQNQDISAKALSDHECDSTEWHFVINQIDSESNAPSSIHVTWANGQSADVSMSKFTGGVAHYSTTAYLDSTVTSATASIYAGWSGEFNLSHGPCGTTVCSTTTDVVGEWSDWAVDPNNPQQEIRTRTITQIDAVDKVTVCGSRVETETRPITSVCSTTTDVVGEWSAWKVDPNNSKQEIRTRTVTQIDAVDKVTVCGSRIETQTRKIGCRENCGDPTPTPTPHSEETGAGGNGLPWAIPFGVLITGSVIILGTKLKH